MNLVYLQVINFGSWETETAMRKNPHLLECHAHAHLWLSSEFVREKLDSRLIRHTEQPNDYLLQNARDLERERLHSFRLSLLEKNMEKIQSTQEEMKMSIAEILQILKEMKSQ